jgi:hypothetical protein
MPARISGQVGKYTDIAPYLAEQTSVEILVLVCIGRTARVEMVA